MRCRAAFLSLVLLAASPAAAGPGRTGVRLVSSLSEAVSRPGTPVLLVFFSTECASCYGDLFEARFAIEGGGYGVDVVGVSAAPAEELAAFLNKFAWERPVISDRRKALFRRFSVDILPFKVFLVGGEAAYRDDAYRGPEARWEELRRCLKKTMKPGVR